MAKERRLGAAAGAGAGSVVGLDMWNKVAAKWPTEEVPKINVDSDNMMHHDLVPGDYINQAALEALKLPHITTGAVLGTIAGVAIGHAIKKHNEAKNQNLGRQFD